MKKPWNFMKKPWNFMKKTLKLYEKTWNFMKKPWNFMRGKNLKLYFKKTETLWKPWTFMKKHFSPYHTSSNGFFWNKGCHYKINSSFNILFNYDRYIKAFIKHWLEHSPRKFLAFQQTLPKFLHKDILR